MSFSQHEYTWAYKLSRRRFFDTAILNIATKTQVVPPQQNEDAKIFRINLSFGGSAIKRFSLLFTYGDPQYGFLLQIYIAYYKMHVKYSVISLFLEILRPNFLLT
jgi:hypothetical protein